MFKGNKFDTNANIADYLLGLLTDLKIDSYLFCKDIGP